MFKQNDFFESHGKKGYNFGFWIVNVQLDIYSMIKQKDLVYLNLYKYEASLVLQWKFNPLLKTYSKVSWVTIRYLVAVAVVLKLCDDKEKKKKHLVNCSKIRYNHG